MGPHEKSTLRLQILKIIQNTDSPEAAAAIIADQFEIKHDAMALAQ